MSYCGNCPDCPSGRCDVSDVFDGVEEGGLPDLTPSEIEKAIVELQELRLEARALARSGNPAVKAEGRKALGEIQETIAVLRSMTDADQ